MPPIKLNRLVSEVKHCSSPIRKALGLMFTKRQNLALIFTFKKEVKVPLHMLFVFYPIDVLYLDEDKKVKEIKENFKPFRFYAPKHKCRYILELPHGIVTKHKIREGSVMVF